MYFFPSEKKKKKNFTNKNKNRHINQSTLSAFRNLKFKIHDRWEFSQG